MEKGLSKTWTQEQEELWVSRLRSCRTDAERHLIMATRDLLKYDGRSKGGKRAMAQARLRLAVATDEDLKGLAELEALIGRGIPGFTVAERLEQLEKRRAMLRKKGIKRSELRCQ